MWSTVVVLRIDRAAWSLVVGELHLTCPVDKLTTSGVSSSILRSQSAFWLHPLEVQGDKGIACGG
jgi:hypothetical protein